MKIIKADAKGIRLAIKYLKAGKSVVYPTDTSYGLGVDATNTRAVRRLYKIKERFYKKPVHVVMADLKMAKKYAKFTPLAEKLSKKLLPGPLTIICDLSPNLSPRSFDFAQSDLEWNRNGRQGRGVRLLSAGTGTIGIRMPKNKIALELVRKFGKPITTTSANPSADKSGGTAPYSIKDSYRQFKSKKYQPDLFLDAGRLPKRQPSTVARIKNGIIKIIRKGPITKTQIQKCIS
jgi:L-threonylcarbamoyladenylate synthase